MSLSNRSVINNYVGSPVTKNDKLSFNVLDDTLSQIRIPVGSNKERLDSLTNSKVSNISTSNLEVILQLLSISNADNELMDLLGLTKISDPLTLCQGNYFINENNNLIKNDLNTYAFSFFALSYTAQEIDTNITIEIDTSKFTSFINFYLPKTSILLSDSNSEKILNYLKIVFIYTINKMFESNRTNIYCYYSKPFKEEKLDSFITNYYEIEPQYNFYLKNYEDVFNNTFSYLNLIPNFYAVNSYLNNNRTPTNTLSLGEKVTLSKKSIASQDYFNDFSKEIKNNLNNQQFLNTISDTYNRVIIDTVVSNNKEISTENFPYVNELKFFNYQNGVADYLIENSLDLLTINNCFSSFYDKNQKILFYTEQLNSNTKFYTKSVSTSSLDVTNYQDVFKFNTSGSIGFEIKDSKCFTFNNNLLSLRGPNNLFKFLKLDNFFNNYYDRFNNFDTILNLQELSCDTVGYFIEKIDNNSIVQTVGLTAEQKNEITYNDTQVAYNKPITYSLYTIDAVPTVKVEYSTIINSFTKLNFNTSIKIEKTFHKNLSFSSTKIVSDSAPLAPGIKFTPFRNVNSTILILFNSLVGSIRETPTVIQSTDLDLFSKLQEKELIKDGKIKFESDDRVNAIQIFRTTNKPTSFNDFSNSLLTEISLKDLTATSYLMDVVPNTKYYLTFRSKDVHGLLSNPSEVFEVESISNSGANYFVINTINLNNNKNFNFNKSFKKYLSITPSFDYTQINVLDNEVKFGSDDKLWGQKFKIRITSKKSGKSFDVNVKYVKNETVLK